MNIAEDFKRPSAFRVLLIAVFLLSSVFFLVDLWKHRRGTRPGSSRKVLREELLRQSEAVGRHLAELETLGVSLLGRYENRRDIGHDQLGGELRLLLREAPESVTGLGLGRFAANPKSRLTVYLAREEDDAADTSPLVFFPSEEVHDDSPREVNLSRRLSWRLAVNPSGRAGSRLTIILNSKPMHDAGEYWESVVSANFSWIGNVLTALEEAGARNALCVTPSNGYIWRMNGRLHYSRDYPATSILGLPSIEQAKDLAESDPERPGFVKTDVIGTGWLLAANDETPGFNWMNLPLGIMLASLAALAMETALGLRNRKKPASGKGGPENSGWLHNILFAYRFTNPEQESIESELRVARRIQFSLVPAAFPRFSEWREFDLHALLAPAREVGGDCYDFCRLDADRLAFLVGDVSGKGVPASLYMAVCQTALRTLVREAKTPGELLARVNDMLVRDNSSGRYVTVAVFFVDMPTGVCRYALAGHPAPIWRHAASGVSDLIDAPRETFVGLKGGVGFLTGEIDLKPGDTLLLYTDGVTEARDHDGNELDLPGLTALFDKAVGKGNCREIVQDLENAVRVFRGKKEQDDDMTLLAFRYWGPGGMKMADYASRTTVILPSAHKE